MNPKLNMRSSLLEGEKTHQLSKSPEFNGRFAKSSDQAAALLLSIASIAKSEIGSGIVSVSDLWTAERIGLPTLFPSFLSSDVKPLTPRIDVPRDLHMYSDDGTDTDSDTHPSSSRLRTVSIDSPIDKFLLSGNNRTPSSMRRCHPDERGITVTPIHSPRGPGTIVSSSEKLGRRLRRRKTSLRMSHKAKQDQDSDDQRTTAARSEVELVKAVASFDHKRRPLQGASPKNIPIKKIVRRKFSWKNYPEVCHFDFFAFRDFVSLTYSFFCPIHFQLEQFLIANRPEYLRHSALNYTLQQKQYNNRLSDRLLELATEHGYVFDIKEFSFVTVRDRIRCYYKSYVQSAKKRGVLMGYAARKAGLLTEDELHADTMGEIVIAPN
jgi:hypothetical protein